MVRVRRGPELISEHLACAQCGYDLFQQSPQGRCPECGLSVKRSQTFGSLESDARWQMQIERGMTFVIRGSIAWTLCLAVTITAYWLPTIGILSFVTAIATVGMEARSRYLLLRTPPGCDPLFSVSSIVLTLIGDVATWLGLLIGGYAVARNEFGTANINWSMAAAATALLTIGAFRAIPIHQLYEVIAQDLAGEKLTPDIIRLMVVRLISELFLFGVLATASFMAASDLGRWPDGLYALACFLTVIYCLVQPFIIGSAYDVWQHVRHFLPPDESPDVD